MSTEIPAGSVIITPAEMWDTIKRIETSVGKIEGQVTPALVDLRDDHDDLRRVVAQNKADAEREVEAVRKDHEDRIRTLEKANWKLIGIYAAITIAASIAEVYYATHH